MRRTILLVGTVVGFAAAAGAAVAGGFRGTVTVDYRYTSGGNITPGSPADVEQTAHFTLAVANNRVVHMHGVVGLDYKWRTTGCPNVNVETTGGGTVDAKPDLGGSYAFLPIVPPNWPRKGRYVTPEPAAPPAKVTVDSTTPDQSCATSTAVTRATFQIGYIPVLVGTASIGHPTRLGGSLTRHSVGTSKCHPFDPQPPPPPTGVSCLWKVRWSFAR